MKILVLPGLTRDDTIGIFTPSHPAYAFSEEKFFLRIPHLRFILNSGQQVLMATR